MKPRNKLIAISLTALAMFNVGAQAATDAAEQQIRSLISTTYDQPGHKVETAPIVVADSYETTEPSYAERRSTS